MLPTAITTMLAALEQASGPRQQADRLKTSGRALVDAPDLAAQLVDEMAGISTVGPREEQLSRLLGAALDEARMARENGQKRGAALVDALEEQLDRLVAANGLSFRGRLLMSACWVRAGLKPPESLASGQDNIAETPSHMETEDPADIGDLFDSLLGNLIDAEEGSASAVHAVFSEMLPTVPADARYALVRAAVSRPDDLYAELGCAWLLDAAGEVRRAAADGLFDRLEAGRLSAQVLARLTIMRSWLVDEALKGRVDELLRAAMRAGVAAPERGSHRKTHRIVASMVDGSGAQSMAAAIQSGRSSRSVAVVLLKQGFGVKDAYVIPCASATEQRDVIATITDEIEACDVSGDYMSDAICLALSDGLEAGIAPVPGLADVAQVCGLTELRPRAAAVGDILAVADPEGETAGLSVQARGRLVNASRSWADRYPMLSSWFEDSDETVEALEKATSRAALNRAMWNVLEARREHWAKVIARNALLLRAAGQDGANEFVAVAAAIMEGRDLKKTPVMQFVFDQSLDVWFDRRSAPVDLFGGLESDLPFGEMPPSLPTEMPPLDLKPEKKGELAKLLEPAGLTEPWLDGYLTGICTAPLFVSPPDWLGPLIHLVSENAVSERKLQRFVKLSMLRYNATLARLSGADETRLIPADYPLLPLWADGYLTAWEANKSCWPAKALGREGKMIRTLLEDATDGRINRTGFTSTLPAWLKQRFAEQRA